ncbi:MAG: nicotinate-nucleotide adenylyltransferase [Bacillus sp. (in: Bacteria)]|nr:nicotinate-nucleotide adenylyltransferase [Bacillus sp. (in: firmicutes)]MCM1425891.1 nicotinate-nucleotide adenylyltransferase [Eubacterium sp.]
MLKVGIMGGTFNPVHIGHLIIAEKAREQFHLDEVLFMPSGVPYMKDEIEVLPSQVRAQMTQLAIEDNPFFTLSTMETEKEGHTYTYETLTTLHEKNPGTEYYFIMGADSLFSIEHWKNPEKIFAGCHILAALRDDKTMEAMKEQAAYLKNKFAADIFLINAGHIEVSSSMIRGLIRDGHSIRYLVPDAVYDYIVKNKLYKAEK